MWKNHRCETLHGYLLANQSARWYTVLVSIMATQASAITFLSTPGQAYADGMRFVQFYFGLPFAMIVLAITAVPLYHRLRNEAPVQWDPYLHSWVVTRYADVLRVLRDFSADRTPPPVCT